MLFLVNGGDGGSRTRVQNKSNCSHSQACLIYYHKPEKIDGYNLLLTVLLQQMVLIFTTYLLVCSNWIEGFEQPPDYAARATSKLLLLFATIVFELLRPCLTCLHYSSFLPCRNHFIPIILTHWSAWISCSPLASLQFICF